MKKTTLIGAAALLAAFSFLGGCASDGNAVAESNGQKAACCGDKSAEAKAGATCSGEAKAAATCSGEAKAATCTGEAKAKASGCCADKAGAAQVK
ncbi:MAG: hypothetical protein Q8L55_15310 [Phycisphaerales bacterium]|nr:hypothetical protein [Phycisphaerales bacterium]